MIWFGILCTSHWSTRAFR